MPQHVGIEAVAALCLPIVVFTATATARHHHPRTLEAPCHFEVAEHATHERGEVQRERLGRRVAQSVVARVLGEAPEEVRPREVVDCVLPRRDGPRDDLGVDVRVQLLVQRGLDGERVVEELAEEGLLGLVTEHDGDALGVVLRAARAANLLQDVGERLVHVGLGLGVVELGALDDDEVRREVDAPRERRRRDEDLQAARAVEVLHEGLVALAQARVVDPDAELHAVLEVRVADELELVPHLVGGHAHKLGRVVLEQQEVDERHRGEARLPARGDEDDHGLRGRLLDDGVVRGLVHDGHARAVVLARVARDVDAHRHGPRARMEVEEGRALGDAEPEGHVARVGHGRGEPDEAHGAAAVPADVAHARDNHLEDRAAVAAEHVHLVEDHERHGRDVAAHLPVAAQPVPLLRRRAQHVGRGESRDDVGRHVAGELDDA